MGTLLFGAISGPDFKAAEQMLDKAGSDVDGIELRLDGFDGVDMASLKAFMGKCKFPLMLTLRRKDQGGAFKGTEEERLGLLESLCSLGPAYVDLEFDVPTDYRKKLFEAYPKVLFLSSYHDFKQTPPDLSEIYNKIKTPYAHICKIAVTAKSCEDALKMVQFVRTQSEKAKIIGICMGEDGKPTRILAPVMGCYLTYAAITADDPSAPGQLTASELQKTYRFRTLNRETAIYALIGDPIDKSLGAVIHNAVFEQQNVNAVYVKVRVSADELPVFLQFARKLPFKGLSVTMPLKEAIMPLLSQLAFQTRAIGACNTVHIEGDQMTGYNTDGIGALNALERLGIVYGRHIVLIGAGGSAKAIGFEAYQRGAFVTFINRTPEKAIELASMFKGIGGGWELFPEVCKKNYDIIINSIPDSDLVDEKWILPDKIAMDIVYVPKNTPFLVKASKKKCRTVFGFEMFIGQALEQLRIWFPTGIDFAKAYALIEEKVIATLV